MKYWKPCVLLKHWKCPISEIRPIDYLRMRRDLREEHAQEKAAKGAPPQ